MERLKKALESVKGMKEFTVAHPVSVAIMEKQEGLVEEMKETLDIAVRGMSYPEEQKLKNLFNKAIRGLETVLAPVYKYFEDV